MKKMIIVETTITKRAWIRDPSTPIEQHGKGHISCPCGQSIWTDLRPETGDVHCPCGTTYMYDGWIIEGKDAKP